MLCFADGKVIIAESKEDRTKMMKGMEKTIKKCNLNINSKTTKIMVCRKKQVDQIAIKLGHHKITQLDKFCYLGSRIASDGRS
jgi:hypothetical protein